MNKAILTNQYSIEIRKSFLNLLIFILLSSIIIIIHYNFHISTVSNNEIFHKKLIPSLEYTLNSISFLNMENIKKHEIEKNLFLIESLNIQLKNLEKTSFIFKKYLNEDSIINLNETKMIFEELKKEIENKMNENSTFIETNSLNFYQIIILYALFFVITIILYEKKKNKLIKEKTVFYNLSQKDKLTSLYNRHYLESILLNYQKQKNNLSYGIILIDIDDFKQINDKFGHNIGDDILKHFSLILKENTRNMDIIGRWGGEEFICIIHSDNKLTLFTIAENLRITIEKSIIHSKKNLTASFGCALCNKEDFIEVIKNADKALYIAKRNGKNRVEMSLE